MGKINVKTGGIILLFSFLLSLILILIFLWFSASATKTIQELDASIGGVYVLSPQSVNNPFIEMDLTDKPIISPSQLSSYYTTHIFRMLPIIMVVFCLTLMIFSIGIWRILLRQQRKTNLLMVENIKSISDNTEMQHPEPVFKAIYDKLLGRFEDHITDYKRLNAYLSHEQKNLLSILRAQMEMNNKKEYIDIINRISESIDDIVTLSDSLENEKNPLVDVELICAAVCDSYKSLTDNIVFDFEEDIDYKIQAKEKWIYRAISNLIDNAVKYGNDKPIEVTVQNKNNSIVVKVQDYGIGIDSFMQEKIFEDRYRVNELQKNGYGIGLSVVSHVCDLCKGFVYVESQKDIGSTFYLTFPSVKAG